MEEPLELFERVFVVLDGVLEGEEGLGLSRVHHVLRLALFHLQPDQQLLLHLPHDHLPHPLLLLVEPSVLSRVQAVQVELQVRVHPVQHFGQTVHSLDLIWSAHLGYGPIPDISDCLSGGRVVESADDSHDHSVLPESRDTPDLLHSHLQELP